MMTDFFRSSEMALNKAEQPFQRGGFNAKYPWRSVPVGSSFAVLCSTIKYASLQALAYKTGKRLGMKFIVVAHAGSNSYEVARVK